jgi:hypothetical protein
MVPDAPPAYIPRIVKHVLLNAFSPMLESIIVDTLSSRQDVTLVSSDPLEASRSGRDVDVVLMSAADPDRLDGVTDLLWRWPRSRVVVVASHGRDAVLWELAPRRVPLGELCPATLVDAVCGERQ